MLVPSDLLRFTDFIHSWGRKTDESAFKCMMTLSVLYVDQFHTLYLDQNRASSFPKNEKTKLMVDILYLLHVAEKKNQTFEDYLTDLISLCEKAQVLNPQYERHEVVTTL